VLLGAAGAILLAGQPVSAQPADPGSLVGQHLSTVRWGQYMAKNCQPTTNAGWPSYPTLLCRYDTDYGRVSVILLNAANDRLAHWLVTACQDAGAKFARHCAERLAVRIKCQSGNQFPVAGFVDEGPLYTFRDGVTVTFSEIGSNHLKKT